MVPTLRYTFFSALLAFLVVGCDDDGPTTQDADSSVPDADAVEDGLGDVENDTEPDIVPDLVPDIAPDVYDAIDSIEEEPTGPCPGSMECFDPNLDRPRASICIQAGFPPDTGCYMTEDESTACCVPPFACETDQDCEDAREEEGFCVDERFACVCNTIDGSCASFVCLTDDECEGTEVCRDGVCAEPGALTGLIARIVSPGGVISEGDTRQLFAVAVDPADASRVFEDVAISWSSDAGDRVAVSSSGLATGGIEEGLATITARVTDNGDDTGDTIEFQNYAASTADLRVVVIDESARIPVPDALVFVEPSTGDTFTAYTDEVGVVELGTDQDPLARPLDISVFDETHGYVTHVGVQGDDLLIVVPPNTFAEVTNPEIEGSEGRVCETVRDEELCFDLEGVGGLVGAPDMSLVANSGEIEVALTGFALGNSLLDLNFELIVGPNIKRDLSGGPIPVDDLAEIPGGVTLAFNAEPMVPFYVINAHPGERTMWSLGGRVSLSDNPTLIPDIIEQIGGDLNIAEIIAAVLPLFNSFYSAIRTDVDIEVPDQDGLNLNDVDMLLSVPVSRRFFISPPNIPTLGDRPLETGLFLAGVSIPGEGFLPLGLTAAADGAGDTPLDGVLDGDPDTLEVDPVQINMSPLNGGIRGPLTQYLLVSVALALDASIGDGESTESTSGIITRAAAGEALPELVTFDEEDFPPLPVGSTYNADTRTITIVPSTFAADFYRVLFKGERGRVWQVHLPASVTSYVVPDPATIDDGLEDRTLRQKINILSVGLDDDNPAEPTYASLLSLAGPTFDSLVDYVRLFAVLEIKN